MNTERFFIAEPYNKEHIRLFDEFEKEHDIKTKTSSYLKETTEKHSKEEYDHIVKKGNEICQSLFLQDNGKIKDSCHIQGEKDIKTCTVFFAPLKTTSKNRRLLGLTMDYAFNVLGMEEIFVSMSEEDKNLKENLEAKGFDNLGETNGSITYIKGKEEINEMRRII